MVQVVPTYVMSCFLLLSDLCDHIEGMISRFWWGSKNGERKIHWISKNSLCKEKKMGGMGFRSFRVFNIALLAKQGWCINNHPESLLAQCLRARYFPRGGFLKASVGYSPRYLEKHSSGKLDDSMGWHVEDRHRTFYRYLGS